MRYIIMAVLAVLYSAPLFAETTCADPSSRQGQVCLRMRHLRAQIFALDSQRELMQLNPDFYGAMGLSLADNGRATLKLMGIGIPEHRQALSSVVREGEELSSLAARREGEMVVTANGIRDNCATCHASSAPAGGVKWDEIFKNDWSVLSQTCSESGRNPYLCKSMNGLLSSYGYLLTELGSQIEDYGMTEQAAREISRILADLRSKGFKHFPESVSLKAEKDAAEIVELASQHNPSVFAAIPKVADSCKTCHDSKSLERDAIHAVRSGTQFARYLNRLSH